MCRKEALNGSDEKPPVEKKGNGNAAATYREAGGGAREGGASTAFVQKVLEENASLRKKVRRLCTG